MATLRGDIIEDKNQVISKIDAILKENQLKVKNKEVVLYFQ